MRDGEKRLRRRPQQITFSASTRPRAASVLRDRARRLELRGGKLTLTELALASTLSHVLAYRLRPEIDLTPPWTRPLFPAHGPSARF
jgi:hypothetical protein